MTYNSAEDAYYFGLVWLMHMEPVLAIIYFLCYFCIYNIFYSSTSLGIDLNLNFPRFLLALFL